MNYGEGARSRERKPCGFSATQLPPSSKNDGRVNEGRNVSHRFTQGTEGLFFVSFEKCLATMPRPSAQQVIRQTVEDALAW
jgi:hypothetical protein